MNSSEQIRHVSQLLKDLAYSFDELGNDVNNLENQVNYLITENDNLRNKLHSIGDIFKGV